MAQMDQDSKILHLQQLVIEERTKYILICGVKADTEITAEWVDKGRIEAIKQLRYEHPEIFV
jgi:hypothetical protein